MLLIRQRAGSMDSSAVAAASRQIHGDLTAVLAPLISATGVEALLARAFDLAKREFPTGPQSGDHDPTNEPFTHVSLWLEWQLPTAATDAAAAMFATFAEAPHHADRGTIDDAVPEKGVARRVF
jgi:hypothetical protein